MKTKNIIILSFSILLGGLICYRIVKNKEKNGESKDKGPKGKPTVVEVITVNSSVFESNISLSGTIDPNEQVSIQSEISGIIEKIYFKEGATVSKGQLLVKIKDAELRAQLKQASSKEMLAKENQRRAALLLEKEAISQEEFEVSRTEYITAQSQTQWIKAQLEKTSIKAPFSGTIGLRNVSEGAFINPSISIANLVDNKAVKINFSVPEKYASNIKLNQTISFSTSNSSEVHQATIYAIEPNISENTRTLQVKALANHKQDLIPGAFASIHLSTEKNNQAIVIPTQAIVPIQNGKVVYLANNGMAKEVKIETGNRSEKEIQILSGLNVGDSLIISGTMSLKDEAPIKVQKPKSKV